jgi:hypothetical protein
MLETPSIRRYSSMSQVTTIWLSEAWAVKIRPVRTISRKGPVPLTGWIESHMTWATGSPDSSMEREASTSLSVESAIVDCRTGHYASTELVLSGRHLSAAGIERALELRAPMNRRGKRRRSDDEIIATLRHWESSEAICRAPSMKQRDEDMVHTSWRHEDQGEL